MIPEVFHIFMMGLLFSIAFIGMMFELSRIHIKIQNIRSLAWLVFYLSLMTLCLIVLILELAK